MFNVYVIHGINVIIGTYIQQMYTNNLFLHNKIKVFEASKVFYSLMYDTTKIISAACFVQFVSPKSKQYFGFVLV